MCVLVSVFAGGVVLREVHAETNVPGGSKLVLFTWSSQQEGSVETGHCVTCRLFGGTLMGSTLYIEP